MFKTSSAESFGPDCHGMNAQSQLKVSVFGHSFVRRLSEYMTLDSSRDSLGLDTNVFSVEVLGFGGLKTERQ